MNRELRMVVHLFWLWFICVGNVVHGILTLWLLVEVKMSSYPVSSDEGVVWAHEIAWHSQFISAFDIVSEFQKKVLLCTDSRSEGWVIESSREQLSQSSYAVIYKERLCVQQGSVVKSDPTRFGTLDPWMSMIKPVGGSRWHEYKQLCRICKCDCAACTLCQRRRSD